MSDARISGIAKNGSRIAHLPAEVNLDADGDDQEPLLGGGVLDSQEVGLLGDLVNCAVDVVDRHLGGDLIGAHIKHKRQRKNTLDE